MAMYKKPTSPKRVPKRQHLQSQSIGAPTKGLNLRDPYASMDVSYAITCTNLNATPQGLTGRRGSIKTAIGLTGRGSSWMGYKGQTKADDRNFCAAGTSIYDVTTSVSNPTPVVTGLLSPYFESVTMTTNGGNYLVACNGEDTARFYSPSSGWSSFSFATTPTAPGQIKTGSIPSLSDWSQVMTHQRRIWIVRKNSTQAFYMPIDSMGGEAFGFDFGPSFPRGGSLRALASWSTDNSTGINNMLVAVSSAGDVALYQGKNPADATTWSLMGVWQLAEPLGIRCLTQFQGDVLYLCKEGLKPLSLYMKANRNDDSVSFSLLIDKEITAQARSVGSLRGWEVMPYAGSNMLILNVPAANPDQNTQFVYNTIMHAWSRWDGVPAQSWCVFNDELFFGSNGFVAKADVGHKDLVNFDGTGGTRYIGRAQQAFYNFGTPGLKKKYIRARPNIVSTTTQLEVKLSFNVEYDLSPPMNSAASSYPNGNTWDSGKWDQATWADGANTINIGQGIRGVGTCGSVAIAFPVNDDIMWVGTDISYAELGPVV